LKRGEGELAYIQYSAAGDAGASRPFTVLNRAMACILAEDFTGASNLLSGLQIRSGTPMEINILALRVLLRHLTGDIQYQSELESLRQTVRQKGDFALQLSPLIILREGLSTKYGPANFASEVFEILNQNYFVT
jgi:hypothetical protein